MASFAPPLAEGSGGREEMLGWLAAHQKRWALCHEYAVRHLCRGGVIGGVSDFLGMCTTDAD